MQLESSAVIQLQVPYSGVSIKVGEKTKVSTSDNVQEKLQLCGMFFFWENGDEDSVLSSFSHCKLRYSGPTYLQCLSFSQCFH